MALIVTSGGLGPTADDLTAEIVGRFAGRELVLDEGMEEKIAAILRKFARRYSFDPEAMREANRKQALVPEGAIPSTPAGTAPGLVVPANGTVVVVLPGPPRELHRSGHERSRPSRCAGARSRDSYATTTLRMFGIPESELAKTLREIEEEIDLSPLEITTCLRQAELVADIRHLRGRGALESSDRRDCGSTRPLRVQPRRGVDRRSGGRASDRAPIGLAESSTGGLLAARLTDRPAPAHLAGSLVAYSDDAKTDLLGVPADLIAEHGAVSPQVADMADGALARFDADIACAITGIAGPDGGTDEKPVGYVCFCAKQADGRTLARDPVLPGSRADVRDRSVAVAMHMLRVLLRGEEPPL